jgi:7-carboxy-7-deazaguanine synthase
MDLATEATDAADSGAAFVVITGGEPLHHNLDELTAAIRSQCAQPVHLETSGVDRLSGAPNWITLSPKRHKPPRPDVLQACHELKVVVHEPEDLLFAEVVAAQAPQANWLLQPGWDCEKGLQLAIGKVQQDQRWRLSMQSHKWLGVR